MSVDKNIPASKKSKTKTKKGKKIVKKILIILIILFVVAIVALVAYSKLRSEYTITYDTYNATRGSISNSLSFSGSMQLIDNVTYYPNANTKVRTVYVTEQQEVKKGDKLIRLADGTSYEADFDGHINKVSVVKDDNVSPDTELVQVADFNHMKVLIRVDEYDINSVSVGMDCKITATATEKTFESFVSSINYISSSGGNVAYYSATIYVDLDGTEGVYPGMQVTVTIPQEEANDVIILKADALSFDLDNSAFVYMMDENGAMIKTPVEVGVSNGNYVEIRSGLNEGDTVYVEVKQADTSGGLFGSMFGSMNINRSNQGGFGGGNMPGGGNGNWNRPNFENEGNNRNGGGTRNGGGNSR